MTFTLLLASEVGIGLIMIVLSIPLIQEKVKPNRWYGFRTAKTLSDEKIWYPANRYAGKAMVGAGAAICGLALLFLFLNLTTGFGEDWSDAGFLLLFSLILYVPVGAMLVASLLYLRKL